MTKANLNTFPYIKELQINDCFAYQNLHVIVNDDHDIPFKHLILTGRNGSGKTTTLNFLYENLKKIIYTNQDIFKELNRIKRLLKQKNKHNPSPTTKAIWEKNIKEYSSILPVFNNPLSYLTDEKRKDILLTKFSAARTTKLDEVKNPTRTSDISKLLNGSNKTEDFRKKLKQYLVNKKVSQAFAQLENEYAKIKSIETFFYKFENILKQIFDNKDLKLIFNNEHFEFYIHLHEKRRITFNEMSDGFSAFLNIILDLFIRIEIIREDIKDKSFNPCGFVLIDEPETHLHYKLQEQVLPILTSLFPNLQFIVATHSPAVISSVKHATIFDLDTQKTLPEWGVGSSYSELMISHFGLENEYSNIADEIINTTESIVEAKNMSPQEKLKQLSAFFERNENYLSPSLKLSLEVQILKLERQLSTIQA